MKLFRRIQWGLGILAAGALLFTGTLPAQAQATRTWVSGVGDDANPCSRTAPCKTFAGAISKTAAGGEINAIDPGGFGAVTITKSITIDGHQTEAGILAAGTNGIIVNAAAGDVVVLRGLDITGGKNPLNLTTAGINGIRVLSAAAVFVEDSTINGFSTTGIDFEPTQAQITRLFVNNVTIQDIGPSGTPAGVIVNAPTGGATAAATISNSQIEFNGLGVFAGANSRVTITNSVISGNTISGVQAQTGVGGAEVNINSSVLNSNTTAIVSGNGATVRIADTMITNNNVGLSPSGTGAIVSYGNNRLHGNGPTDNQNGAPTQTIAQQ